jgi:hypothetical protein
MIQPDVRSAKSFLLSHEELSFMSEYHLEKVSESTQSNRRSSAMLERAVGALVCKQVDRKKGSLFVLLLRNHYSTLLL